MTASISECGPSNCPSSRLQYWDTDASSDARSTNGAVDPETNEILHAGLHTQRTIVATKMFLPEIEEKHEIGDAEFFVDGAPWLDAGLHELGMHFLHETHGDRNPVERSFQETERKTRRLYGSFTHADPETVEN